MEKYIMAIDEGTTSARAILFDHESHVVYVAQKEFTQYFEKPGWVAQDGNEIWLAVQAVMAQCIINSGIKPNQVVAIGITNQRETAIIWNKETGLPICKAIVWQSRQTEDICDDLIRKGYNQLFASKTGLRIDPYFSATKYRWMLDHIEGAQQLAMEGKLLAGTIDSWLIWKLSNGQAHVTDYSNASRTLLYNIYEKCWDKQLCDILNIPMQMLPQVKDSSCIYANTDKSLFFGHRVPISGVAGDQQAALFGQGCFNKGDAKNTYGTGGFLLMNTGEEPLVSQDGLLTTIAWGINGQVYYALEGSIFVSGSAIQWLRDQMKFFASSKDSEQFANNASKDNQVIVVPAFVGFGAPYWDDKARGAIFGITRGTTQQDITQATLESLAYQTKDVLDAMVKTCNTHIDSLQVDGGASANNYLMQFQADILQCHIKRNAMLETTALGAARLAGLAVGYWKQDDFKVQDFREFKPLISKQQSDMKYDKWLKAVAATQLFTK